MNPAVGRLSEFGAEQRTRRSTTASYQAPRVALCIFHTSGLASRRWSDLTSN